MTVVLHFSIPKTDMFVFFSQVISEHVPSKPHPVAPVQHQPQPQPQPNKINYVVDHVSGPEGHNVSLQYNLMIII